MPPISALLHTFNDGPRLGRALETLHPCGEILIVDHHSTDSTLRIARSYGARILKAIPNAQTALYLEHTRHDWILCLTPSESLTEGLQATLFEWSSMPNDAVAESAFGVAIREQVDEIWRQLAEPETRLVPRHWEQWNGYLPASRVASRALEGELLRLAYP